MAYFLCAAQNGLNTHFSAALVPFAVARLACKLGMIRFDASDSSLACCAARAPKKVGPSDQRSPDDVQYLFLHMDVQLLKTPSDEARVQHWNILAMLFRTNLCALTLVLFVSWSSIFGRGRGKEPMEQLILFSLI